MNDVVRKRLIGAAVIVFVGVMIPLLLVQFLSQQPGSGDQAMRVYKITPSGSVKLVSASGTSDSPRQQATTTAPEQHQGRIGRFLEVASAHGFDLTQPSNSGQKNTVHTGTVDTQNVPDTVATTQSRTQNTQQQVASLPEPDPEPASQPEPVVTAETMPEASDTTASPEPADNDPLPIKRDVSDGAWVVQVASFQKQSNARALARTLVDHFSAYYTEAVIDGTTWYRVRVGPLENEAVANNMAGELRAAGHNTLVLQVG